MKKLYNLYPFSEMPFGIYKGFFIVDLIKNNSEYLVWLIKNVETFSISLLHFETTFLLNKRKRECHAQKYEFDRYLNLDKESYEILKHKNELMASLSESSNINIGSVVKLKTGYKKYLVKEKVFVLGERCYFNLLGINTFSKEGEVSEDKIELAPVTLDEKKANTEYYNRITFQNKNGIARQTYGLKEINFYLCYLCGYRETIQSSPYYEEGKIKFPITDKKCFTIKSKSVPIQNVIGHNPIYVYQMYELAEGNLENITSKFYNGAYLDKNEMVFLGACPKCGCNMSKKEFINLKF